MMRQEAIFRALSEVDEDLVEEALTERATAKGRSWVRSAGLAAAVMLVAGAGFFALHGREAAQPPAPSAAPVQSADAVYVKRWEERELHDRYSALVWDGEDYGCGGPVAEKYVGEVLGHAEAKGWDWYTEEEHTLPCTVYALKGIAHKVGVAVEYEGEEGFYTFRAENYTAATLGELIEDMNLAEYLELGLIYYNDAWRDSGRASTYRLEDREGIWAQLLADETLQNEGSEHYGYGVLGCSVSVEPLGIRNLSLAVNAEGYLQTNLIATGASYYLGKERVEAFKEFVFAHGEGVAWPEPEPEGGDAGTPEGETAPSAPPAVYYVSPSQGPMGE